MFENIINNCTWWLLPLLILAFLLGWLFWHFFKGTSLWSKIRGLESDNSDLNGNIKELKKELSEKDNTYASLNTEYKGLNDRFASMQTNYHSEQKAKGEVEVELEEWKNKYAAVDSNWGVEKSRVLNLQTRYNTDLKTEQSQRARLDASHRSLQKKFEDLEANYQAELGKNRKWENDYSRLKEKHVTANADLLVEIERMKKEVATIKSEADNNIATAVNAEANQWNIKLEHLQKQREEDKNQWNLQWADLERKKDAEINQLNLKWTNFENSQKDDSKDWEMKLAAAKSEKDAAVKAEAEKWNQKFTNLQSEAAAAKEEAVKAETVAWNLKLANAKKDAEAEKEAAVKEEHDRWSLKWEAHQKEMAAAQKLAAATTSDDEKKTILKTAKAFYPRIKWDDLKVVEGIGPKIEGLCHDIGIKTWKALSEADYDTLKKMLTDAGSRYQMHDPKTWPKQAGMAYRNEWKELNKWQDEHSHGRE